VSFGYSIRPTADRDIDEIADYLAGESGLDFGLLFLSDIYKTLALLSGHRELGWPCKVDHPSLRGARAFRVSSRFEKFLIFYQTLPGHIEILRVLHGSRDLELLLNRESSG
jgi:toxin ParE1/3/4